MKVVKGSLGFFKESWLEGCMYYNILYYQLDKPLHNHNVGLLYIYKTLSSLVM